MYKVNQIYLKRSNLVTLVCTYVHKKTKNKGRFEVINITSVREGNEVVSSKKKTDVK